MIGQASKDERNKYKNGKAGDQTTVEVYMRSWFKGYNVVIRCKDPKMREMLAVCMERACRNDLIGYNQNKRNTLWNLVKLLGFDPRNVHTPCDTDCSALLCVCCAYAGVPIKFLQIANNCLTTSTLKKYLLKSGYFEVLTAKKYLTSDKYLLRGDILLNEGHHVYMQLNDGSAVIQAAATGSNAKNTSKFVFGGVDYSLVFDPEYYKNAYPDLTAAGLNTNALLFNHFTQHGMNEARVASKDFNVIKYRKAFADLDAAFGNNWPAYYNHYLQYGRNEIINGKRNNFM